MNTHELSDQVRTENENASFDILNTSSDINMLYRLKAPFQVTYEFCSGINEDDFLNVLSLSPNGPSYTQEPIGLHNYIYHHMAPHFHDYYESLIVFDGALWLALPIAMLAGLISFLSPCVLPLVPINLVRVGRGWERGLAYGLGIALAYGALGIAAALGGMAFGTIQSSPWFSALVAVVFTVLGLAMSELLFIDFSKYRGKVAGGQGKTRGLGGVFLLGVGAAVLASSGAVMDLAMDIAAGMDEIVRHNPSLPRRALFLSGLRIGRSVVGTMTTTLLLAYSGGYITLLMVFAAQGTPPLDFLNSTLVSAEVVKTLVGSFALVLVAPFTAFVGAAFVNKAKVA